MEYRKLGRTGLKVSELCMGTMQFGWTADEALSHKILSATVDGGINFLDTADIYTRWMEGNPGGVAEEIIGRWMKQNDIRRNQIVIATKVRGQMGDGPNDQGLSRTHIFNAVEDSLRRLQTDYIDLYQTHWFDDETPIEETLKAMDDLVKQGKVRYIGCSNYPTWRLMRALWTSDVHDIVRYDSIQPNYSLVYRDQFERETAEVCRIYGIGVIPYSPLAGGFLTGKYRRDGERPESARAVGVEKRHYSIQNWAVLDAVEEIATARGKSISQISLGWMLSDPVITSPIIGPRTMEQLEDNLGAAGVRLTEEEKEKLDEVSNWKN